MFLDRFRINRFLSFPIVAGILPESKLLSMLSIVRLTRLLISTGMEPDIWLDQSNKYSRLGERLGIDTSRLPFIIFPSRANFVSCVQFVREERNCQSYASS